MTFSRIGFEIIIAKSVKKVVSRSDIAFKTCSNN